MAEVRVRADNGHDARTIGDAAQQVAFLQRHGIGFEQWPIDRYDADKAKQVDDAQAYILEAFAEEIERLKSERGYKTADVIALYPDTANLDTLLAKFDKEHYHGEDEVRFVVHGRGVFTIHSDEDDSVFDVEVEPGDLLIVPEGTWHWFTLCEDRTIQCIRVYADGGEGWVPHYR